MARLDNGSAVAAPPITPVCACYLQLMFKPRTLFLTLNYAKAQRLDRLRQSDQGVFNSQF